MLNANALTTAQRLSDYLGETSMSAAQQARYEAIINTVSKMVERYTGQSFKKTEYVEELRDVEAAQTVNLKHFPVSHADPIILETRNSGLNNDTWYQVDSDLYAVDYENGIVEAMGTEFFARSRNGYRITYSSGYVFDNVSTFLSDTEAGDVELAVWIMCQDIFNSSGSGAIVKSEKIGDYSVTYQDQQLSASSAITNPVVMNILDAYISPTLAAALTPLQSN